MNMETEIKRQERNGKLVEREILACQSGLVGELLEKGVFNYKDVENLYMPKCPECGDIPCDIKKDDDGILHCGYCDKVFDEEPESEPQEIFEWWLVTEWMAEKLKEQGEPILSYDNFNYWWGRCCTGQSIKLDHVIDRICEKIG